MCADPRRIHKEHHLSVRQTPLRTYIICQECGQEYDTAWNYWYQRLGHRLHRMLSYLFIGVLLLFNGLPDRDSLPSYLLCLVGYISFITIASIGLNAIYATLLRHENKLSSRIIDEGR